MQNGCGRFACLGPVVLYYPGRSPFGCEQNPPICRFRILIPQLLFSPLEFRTAICAVTRYDDRSQRMTPAKKSHWGQIGDNAALALVLRRSFFPQLRGESKHGFA
jgi:hypothetical protein